MLDAPHLHAAQRKSPIVVIGAGIGGLCAALPLARAGHDVTVVDSHAQPGGKMRQIGGVDAGPTVLTMRHVFDRLFAGIDSRLEDHVTLHPQDILARHWWPDGSTLDLHADPDATNDAIRAFAGPRAEQEFRAFCAGTETLFKAFRAPVMESPKPDILSLTRLVMSNPGLLWQMAPGATLSGSLRRRFTDPRLRQLFGRYATYVGGIPSLTPALLALVWQAECEGVWVVEGGMHRLARAIADAIEAQGGRLRMNSHVTRILADSEGVTGVALRNGSILPAKTIVFNGDPRALALGQLGSNAQTAEQALRAKRSLSAHVWAFSSKPSDLPLAHHNVFFCENEADDFNALRRGELPDETTLYVCAEDRGLPNAPPETERFEIILNAPPLTQRLPSQKEFETCHQRTFPTLRRFGLSFSPEPTKTALTTPAGFDALFPASAGSLYGQSPHGTFAALSRPQAETKMPGLYLAGGGCHPGAGVPMAALSGRHAAEAILTGQTSTSTSHRTVTPGGMSMRSQTAGNARSR